MNVILVGCGRMGKMLEDCMSGMDDMTLVGAYGTNGAALGTLADTGRIADVVIDFSGVGALPEVAEYVRRTGTALVSGVTGYSAEQLDTVRSLGDYAPVIHSANFSLGIALMTRLVSQMAQALGGFDIELTETHHNKKADAPSGTAKMLLNAIDPEGELTPVYGREGACGARTPREIGVHAIRGGTVAGEHTVSFFGDDEILEITHKASSRRIFANGALRVARGLAGKPNGYYELQSFLFGEGA